jgi:AsmA protein
VNARTPNDLHQIRPSAELDRQHSAPTGSRRRRPPRRPRSAPRRRRGWPLWARVVAGIFGLIALTGAGLAGVLYVASPTELVRSELIRQVKANTGRDLRIKGRSSLVFYPSIGVSLADVELSGPPGMSGAPMLTAERINLSVALIPLLSRKVRIEHVGLMRPMIDLHVDKRGRQSWEFSASSPPRRVRVAELGAGLGSLNDALPRSKIIWPATVPGAAGLGFLDEIELRSVTLTKAIFIYRDDRSGFAHRLDDLDLRLNGRRISDPMKARGGFVWQNERLDFDIRLDTLSQIIAGRSARARVTVSGRPLSAGFDGTVKLSDAIAVAGQTRLNGDSIASAARWLGMEFPNAAPLGGFQVSGRLVGSPESVALNGASLSLGSTRGTGVILVALRPKRPYISADLKLNEVDIDRLSAGFAGGKAIPRSALSQPGVRDTRSDATRRGAPARKPKSIEDLLRRPSGGNTAGRGGVGRFAPQVRGYTNRNEWSSDPIDASALGLLDAKARLRIDGLKVAGLAIGRTVLRVELSNRRARIDIDDLQLYGGAGKGVISAGPSGRGVGFGANLRIDKIAARAFLKDAAGFERLDGRGLLVAVVSGRGTSQKSIANSLSGTAKFLFKDGAIVGWNLAKIMRGVQKGQFSNIDATPSEQTDFSEMSASFSITNGIAATNNLRMVSPLLRLSGQGNVGIGKRNLDLALRPKLVSSLHGQGANADSVGLEIPVKLWGPWHDPGIEPDYNALSKNPGQLWDKAKQLGKQYKGKNIGEIVRGVLGEDRDGGNSKTDDLVKKLFGR